MQRQRTALGRKRNPTRMLNTCSERDCCNPKTKGHTKGDKELLLPILKRKRSFFFLFKGIHFFAEVNGLDGFVTEEGSPSNHNRPVVEE